MTRPQALASSLLVIIMISIVTYLYFIRLAFSFAYGNQDSTEKSIRWHAYLEMHPAVWKMGIDTAKALYEYNSSIENSPSYAELTSPDKHSWDSAAQKLHRYLNATVVGGTNMIIYNIEDIGSNDNAIDVTMNNIRVFVSSILLDDTTATFYWINVGGITENPAKSMLPTHLSNVAVADWPYSSSSFHSFAHTMRLLHTETLVQKVSAVFSLNSGVRGPLQQYEHGAWIAKYKKLLDANNVGLVGPVISCEGGPHVQPHVFAVKTMLVPTMLSELDRYYKTDTFEPIERYFQHRLSAVVQTANFKLASLLHLHRKNAPHFQAECITFSDDSCVLHPAEVLFLKWDGEDLGGEGYVCGKGIAMSERSHKEVQDLSAAVITAATQKLAPIISVSLQLTTSEVTSGGLLHDLYKEYEAEYQRGLVTYHPKPVSDAVPELPAVSTSVPMHDGGDKVCFLVRTAKMHDPAYQASTDAKFSYVEMDLEVFAKSLIMQTNRNWLAYFIITDPSPFEKRLAQLLDSFNDPRLMYFDVSLNHRPVFSKVDAGYTTTDYVMDQLLQRKECKWLSATNGDNAYGSEVVDRILNAPPLQNSKTAAQPDMLLLPMDSRNFADQDARSRGDSAWNKKCVGIESMGALNQLVSTAGAMPKIARLDLAALVVNRQKLLAENVKFGNFSDIKRYHCAGCNDGYFTQYLVRNRGWTYARLPLDGLRSLMFHGPSPTHCIAAGNVWFDHPLVGKVGCLSHATVHKILGRDMRREKAHHYFDWKHFNNSAKICLRLNQHGFASHSKVLQRRLTTVTGAAVSHLTSNTSLVASVAPSVAGPSSRRLADAPCDWKMYLKLNPDLQATITETTAATHYEHYGKAEQRECNFDWKQYVHFNPDLKQFKADQALQHYVTSGKREGRIHKSPENFNWIAYLEGNLDLYHARIFSQKDATNHYQRFGLSEGRSGDTMTPSVTTWQTAIDKMDSYFKSSTHPVERRNLVIYHVEDVGSNDNAYDLTANNVKVFVAALLHHHSSQQSDQAAFYLFNVAAISDNPLERLIPTYLTNVAVARWVYSSSAFNSFAQSMRLLTPSSLSHLSAVFSMSSGVRGPLHQYEHGAWIAEYRKLLDANNVGLVGPVISCEGAPHVQPNTFALRTALVSQFVTELDKYYKIISFVPIEEYFREKLSALVQSAKYNIASMLHARRRKQDRFQQGQCIDFKSDVAAQSCEVHPSEVLFVRWSGEALGAKDFICGKGIAMSERSRELVQTLTEQMTAAAISATDVLPPHLLPALPEALTGWLIYEEYNRELAVKPNSAGSVAQLAAADREQSKVCFLVEVDATQDSASKASKEAVTSKAETVMGTYDAVYVQDMLQTLSIQTNPNWKAFLYTSDERFQVRLIAIAAEAKDVRLSVLPHSASNGRHGAPVDQLLQRKECKWLSATNGDNAYGSEVVDRILNSPALQDSKTAAQPDMLLLPTDSRDFAVADYDLRGDHAWDDRCVGVDTMVNLYQTTYTAQPVPTVGHVKIASVVLDRLKLAREPLILGNFSFSEAFHCSNCDEGQYAQYLVRNRGWTYARLPLDGLRSLMFHGPSPTHCIAAGNVWFDHACPQQAGCLSHQSILALHAADRGSLLSKKKFDWDHFYFRDQLCLRYSKAGFDAQRCT